MRTIGFSRLTLLPVVAASMLACVGATNTVTVGTRLGMSLAGSPQSRQGAAIPLSLGLSSLGKVAHPSAALSVADSIVRAWGWRVASVEPGRAELRTEWLYIAGPDLVPGAGRQCDGDAPVGLRLEIGPRGAPGDSGEFTIRGEAQLLDGPNRSDAQRWARRGLAAVTSSLKDGVRASALRPDTLTASVAHAYGEVSVGSGGRRELCATVRP